MEKVKILGKSFKGKFTTPRCIEKHAQAIYGLEAAAKSLDAGTQNDAEAIAVLCNKISEALDDFFGKGAAVRVLGPEPSLTGCLDAFFDFIQIYTDQITPRVVKRTNKALEAIREQRRGNE